jgi:hypothetical protein
MPQSQHVVRKSYAAKHSATAQPDGEGSRQHVVRGRYAAQSQTEKAAATPFQRMVAGVREYVSA